MKQQPLRYRQLRDELHRQLRREVEDMRGANAEMANRAEERSALPARPLTPPHHRFEPIMPKGYVNCDQLRCQLQARVAGAPKDEASDLNAQQYWWNEN